MQTGREQRRQDATGTMTLDFWSLASSFYFLFYLLFFIFSCPSCSGHIYFIYVDTLSLSSDTAEEGIGSHYRWLWATMWFLGIELRTFERAVSALNCWAISPVPLTTFQTWVILLSAMYICSIAPDDAHSSIRSNLVTVCLNEMQDEVMGLIYDIISSKSHLGFSTEHLWRISDQGQYFMAIVWTR